MYKLFATVAVMVTFATGLARISHTTDGLGKG
jgi:hypothetical protein